MSFSPVPAYEPPNDEQLVNFVTAMLRPRCPGASKETVRGLLEGSEIVKDAWLQHHREMQAAANALEGGGGLHE
jgi:hypothetical protein